MFNTNNDTKIGSQDVSTFVLSFLEKKNFKLLSFAVSIIEIELLTRFSINFDLDFRHKGVFVWNDLNGCWVMSVFKFAFGINFDGDYGTG